MVSVVIAVKNGERFLASALQSVLEQDYEPVEIIVVDGQSVDSTAQIAQTFPKVRYIRQPGQGLWDAYNLGIKASQGEFIGFLAYDDLWAPHKLRLQVGYLTRHPEYHYIIGRIKFFLEAGCLMPANFRQGFMKGEYAIRTEGNVLVRKTLFDSIGIFNPEFSLGAHIDWFARVQSLPMAIVDEVVLYKRIHDSNYSLFQIKSDGTSIFRILKQSLERKRIQKVEKTG